MEISTVLEKSCFECCVAQKFSRQRDEGLQFEVAPKTRMQNDSVKQM
jgi:hypothetical protein